MKKLLSLTLVLLLTFGIITKVLALTVSNTFSGSGALDSNYTPGRNAETQSSGVLLGSVGGDWNSEFYTGSAWANDQYSESKISAPLVAVASFPTFWVMVRMTNPGGTNNEQAYAIGLTPNGSNADVVLYRINGANYNTFPIATLATNQAYSVGDVFRLKVVGTTLSAYQNGVQIGTDQTDANVASGSPGLGTIGTNSANGSDSWTGSDDLNPAVANTNIIANIAVKMNINGNANIL